MVNNKFETVGELFCGPGGGAIGASMSSCVAGSSTIRMKHLWATDYDNDSCETYRKNISKFESSELGFDSNLNIVSEDINSDSINLRDESQFPYVDGLVFGFPCNDFSIVGESKGLNGKFGPLFQHGITILERVSKPKWFIAENVGGLSSSNGGKALTKILLKMKAAGYTVTPHKYKFEQYGIPQNRHRIIIVGLRDDLKLKFLVPKPSMKYKTVAEALKGIPEDAKHQEYTRQSSRVIQRLKHIKPGQNAWNADLPKDLELNVPRARLSHIYKRLDPNKPAYTVTGSGGGGTHMYHWNEPRALTNRERARIQTFPDWFNFTGTKESIRRQIGMAIPPEGMKIICNALLQSIYGEDYEFINESINIEK